MATRRPSTRETQRRIAEWYREQPQAVRDQFLTMAGDFRIPGFDAPVTTEPDPAPAEPADTV